MSIKQFSAAGLVALSLSMGAVGTLCTTAAPALAAPTANPSDSAVNPSTINPNGTFELKITKYLGGAVKSGVQDGTQQTVTGHDVLQGVPFDIYQVQDVDLTTTRAGPPPPRCRATPSPPPRSRPAPSRVPTARATR